MFRIRTILRWRFFVARIHFKVFSNICLVAENFLPLPPGCWLEGGMVFGVFGQKLSISQQIIYDSLGIIWVGISMFTYVINSRPKFTHIFIKMITSRSKLIHA